MPTKFDVQVRLNIPREELWRVRASRTFMSFLVKNGALQRMDATYPQPSHPGFSKRERRQTYVPGDVIIPDIVKTIIDDSYIEIGDDQTWDDEVPFVQDSMIRPTILGDVISTQAQLSLESDPDDKDVCIHKLAGKVSVSLLFVGYYVEQAVVTNMKTFYDNYPVHIEGFVHMVTAKYGDGTRACLSKAIDKMLVDEKSL